MGGGDGRMICVYECLSIHLLPTSNRWSSDGSGVFKVENVPQIEGSESASKHGTKITMHLMDSCKDYSDADKIKE